MSNRFVGASGAKSTRLEESVRNGDAYGALQTYKTFYARAKKKGDVNVAVDFLRSGSVVLLQENHLTAGTELALLLAELLQTESIEQDDEVKQVILEVSAAFDSVSGDETKVKEAAKNQARFLKACIEWSCLKKLGQYARGDPEFHLLRAKAMIRMGNLPGASANFLHAGKPKDFAAFLVQWSSKGYQGEMDLFLARAILQLLALENLKDANELYLAFHAILQMNKVNPPVTPLANFVRYMLRTVERDAYPLFQMLCQKYASSIQRDQSFQLYLDRIQESFFGVKAPKRGMQAMMDNMLGMFSR